VGIPLCPKSMDNREERPAGIPLCPESVDYREERPAGIPLCPKSMDNREEITTSMIIESIELKNYRNYDELHMDFSQGTNILYGDNAQGKTNVLEAIYVCATTKSHRGSKE